MYSVENRYLGVMADMVQAFEARSMATRKRASLNKTRLSGAWVANPDTRIWRRSVLHELGDRELKTGAVTSLIVDQRVRGPNAWQRFTRDSTDLRHPIT